MNRFELKGIKFMLLSFQFQILQGAANSVKIPGVHKFWTTLVGYIMSQSNMLCVQWHSLSWEGESPLVISNGKELYKSAKDNVWDSAIQDAKSLV